MFQCLTEIFDDILRILNSHGEAEEALVKFLRVEILPLVIFTQEHDEALVMAQGDPQR